MNSFEQELSGTHMDRIKWSIDIRNILMAVMGSFARHGAMKRVLNKHGWAAGRITALIKDTWTADINTILMHSSADHAMIYNTHVCDCFNSKIKM